MCNCKNHRVIILFCVIFVHLSGKVCVTEHTVMAEEQAADYDQVVQDLTGLLASEAVPVTVVDFQRKDASKQMFLDSVTY